MAGTHLGILKTSANPAWVDHTSDRLIKGYGRSCSLQGNGAGAPSPFVYNWPWLVAGSPDADQVSFISQTSSSRPPPTTIGGLLVERASNQYKSFGNNDKDGNATATNCGNRLVEHTGSDEVNR